jgi:alkanesulfonate monooxygenase SsuD/methylene tetrahydromethanopterin reductase-like flavin-dependent oxidoreductase (luciferase family)
MIDELRGIVQIADELGITAFGTTEHHFHTEGGEAMPSPVVLYADLAARTSRIMFIPTSIVLPAHDPIRVAEDIALLDNLTRGRVAVTFARGYQKRWVQVLSQGGPTALDKSAEAADVANRERFDEFLDIVYKAWTEDAWDYNGKHYQVPYPYDEGIRGWPAVEWTREFGVDGEIDADGVIRRIGVIPRPYQQPHPRVFVPFAVSAGSLLAAARRGIGAWISAGDAATFLHSCEVYRDEARSAGHDVGLGDRIGAVRGISLGDTYEEAFDIATRTMGYEYFHYWSKFGFAERYRNETDDPNDRFPFASEADLTRRMIEKGHQLCGTVDDVRRQLEVMQRCYGDGSLEWLCWDFFCQGILSFDESRRQLELFATKVWPDFQ